MTDQTPEEPKAQSPQEFLATLPNAPTPAQIREWKMQVPGGRIRMFVPPGSEGKRAYIVRAISGLELAELYKSMPQNIQNTEIEIQLKVAVLCTLWSSEKGTLPYSEIELKSGPAGTVDALYQIINNLSDFYEPMQLLSYSADL